MKKILLLASICSMLLMAVLASAEVSGDYFEARYLPSQVPNQQRLLVDEYRNYFYFDQLARPETQRILDVESLEIDRGDLATPAIAGAQRILNEDFAWRYGYDLETGEPLLSPYGERKVLKAGGFAGSPISLQSASNVQMKLREDYRTKRARTMARWLANQHRRLPVIRRYSSFPLNSIQSLEGLDIRPIYLNEYEQLAGVRDVHSNLILRQHFMRDLPGISYSELRRLAGEGQLKSDVLGRLEFLGREGVEDDTTYSDLATRYGENMPENSNVLNRAVFLRTRPEGIIVYERFPETRQESPMTS